MTIFIKSKFKISGNFKDWLNDYLQNSSIAGCTYYVTPDTSTKERFFWLAVHVTCIILVALMTVNATLAYTSTPTVTTVETDKYAIQEVEFPGVAICDVNKISRSSAEALAGDILDEVRQFGNISISELADMLKYFGHFHTFEWNESERKTIQLLHRTLRIRYGKNYVPYVLKKLATKCHETMKYCSWGGHEYVCEDLTNKRVTADGFCCIFNYVRPNDNFGSVKDAHSSRKYTVGNIEHSDAVGLNFGLTLLLNSDPKDHYYKTISIQAYKILIFAASDYPDVYSGSLHEVLVPYKMVSWITLQATTLYSVPEVSMYAEDQRDCRFRDELASIFEGHYSHSDCIMNCRVIDILQFCECIPFFYPSTVGDSVPRTCDLTDLPCLKKYRNRWWSVRPRFEKRMISYNSCDPNSSDDVLNCSECLPACTDVLYKVTVHSAPLITDNGTVKLGENRYSINHHSVVHIFFKNVGTVKLKQDLLFYWYELMSNYGGICGFFLGISIISIVEMLYFFTLRLYKQKKNLETLEQDFPQFIIVKAARSNPRPLYWKEIMPQNYKY